MCRSAPTKRPGTNFQVQPFDFWISGCTLLPVSPPYMLLSMYRLCQAWIPKVTMHNDGEAGLCCRAGTLHKRLIDSLAYNL